MQYSSGYNHNKIAGENATHGHGDSGMATSDEVNKAEESAGHPDNELVAAKMRWRRRRLALYRRIWTFAWVLIIAFVVEALFIAWFSPRYYIYRMDVRNVETMTQEEVTKLADVKPGTNFYRADLAQIARRIKSQDPRVDNVAVERGSMGTLLLLVNERKAVCRIGTSEPPMYLDQKGYLFTRPVPPSNAVPMLTGVDAPNETNMGKKLTDAYVVPMLKAIAALPAQTDKGFVLELATVKINDQSGVTYELTNGITIEYGQLNYPVQKATVLKSLIDQAINDGYTPDQLNILNVTCVDNKYLSGTYSLRTPIEGGNL